jgi:hypothetical protein
MDSTAAAPRYRQHPLAFVARDNMLSPHVQATPKHAVAEGWLLVRSSLPHGRRASGGRRAMPQCRSLHTQNLAAVPVARAMPLLRGYTWPADPALSHNREYQLQARQ